MPTRIAETDLLTATTLIIIAILAVITILGILWGMRLKRQRRDADRIEEARVEEDSTPAAVTETAPEPAPEPEPETPPSPPPVAPAPPPLDDALVAGTPALAGERIAAAAPQGASPASEAGPEPAAPPQPAPDRPVTDIKGLGPKVATRLAALGITNVAQIAALDAGEAEHIDAHLGPFTGRMARDRWIEQARFLAAGDVKGFEAVFGRL